MPRRGFASLVLLFAFAAACCGLVADPPHPSPVDALESGAVYRVEVALAIFAGLYLMAITVRLAWHGQTFTRVGSVLEVPEVQRPFDAELMKARTEVQRGSKKPAKSCRPSARRSVP